MSLRKPFKLIFTVLLVFCVTLTCISDAAFSSVSSALNPQYALSTRPDESFYVSARLDDLSGILQEVFSQTNVDLAASLMSRGDAENFRIAATFASQIPAKSIAFVLGFEKATEVPFFQLAISMPDSARPELDRVARGEATMVDIVTLLMGKAGLVFASVFTDTDVEWGPKGAYYTLGPAETPVLAAREGLLLISLSPGDLEASIGAIENETNRLALKRRFDTPDYCFTHIDVPTLSTIILDDDDFAYKVFLSSFKAPLNMEVAFDSRPEKFTVSSWVNIAESLIEIKDGFTKPAVGANLFLAGEGKLFSAFAFPTSFKASDLRVYPDLYRGWISFIRELATKGITEKNVEDLLTGTFSFVLGNESSIMGRRAPGGYIALSGQNGAARKILARITGDTEIMRALPFTLTPLKADKWDLLFEADPSMSPVPVILGVSGETLLLGLVDPDGLDMKPELPLEAERLFKEPLIAGGFIDAAAIWKWFRMEISDEYSPLATAMDLARLDELKAYVLKNLLNSELSIPFIKIWIPEFETGFTEFTIADVPPEKRILPKLLTITGLASASATDSAEAATIISKLRSMKAASLMFFADHMDEIADGKMTLEINHLLVYMDTEHIDNAYITAVEGEYWWVGYDLKTAGKSQGVRERLKSRAQVGLFGEKSQNAPYSGEDIVWMMAK